MKRIEISRLFVFMVVYLFILVIAAVLPISISHFNYVFLVVFTCLSFLLFLYLIGFLVLLFWVPIFILLYLFQPERSFLYCVNDILIILCLLHFVYVSQKTYIAFDELKFLRTCLWLYIGMTMIFSFFPSFYNDEGRFLGLMKGVNLSASVSMMLLILLFIIRVVRVSIFLRVFSAMPMPMTSSNRGFPRLSIQEPRWLWTGRPISFLYRLRGAGLCGSSDGHPIPVRTI